MRWVQRGVERLTAWFKGEVKRRRDRVRDAGLHVHHIGLRVSAIPEDLRVFLPAAEAQGRLTLDEATGYWTLPQEGVLYGKGLNFLGFRNPVLCALEVIHLFYSDDPELVDDASFQATAQLIGDSSEEVLRDGFVVTDGLDAVQRLVDIGRFEVYLREDGKLAAWPLPRRGQPTLSRRRRKS